MRREPPVRIREGLGVKFPRATRLVILCRTPEEASRALELVRTWVSDNGLTLHPTKTAVVAEPAPVATPAPVVEPRVEPVVPVAAVLAVGQRRAIPNALMRL